MSLIQTMVELSALKRLQELRLVEALVQEEDPADLVQAMIEAEKEYQRRIQRLLKEVQND